MKDLIEHKIFGHNEWKSLPENLYSNLTFTNGCFDILHPGHLIYLAEASKLSQNMIIGLNSDESVRNLKGDSRPINELAYRAQMLAALPFVAAVIEFAEETPLRLIEFLKPDYLVKGGDYNKEEIVGAKEVELDGGEVVIIPFVGEYSTTALIEKIKKLK